MGEKKVTLMLLKVDLDCTSCYKKVKKTLCKFPQIRDQVYDEKNNTVKITVICCSPEKIRDKLCCKGGGVIKSIEILEPAKPKEAEKPKQKEPEKPKEAAATPKEAAATPKEKPKEAEKPKEKPKEAEKPKEKPKEVPKNPQPAPPAAVLVPVSVPAPAPMPKQPVPLANVPAPAPLALEAYPMPYFNGQYAGGPCYQGYGMPVQPCYDNYGNGYGYGYAYGQGQGQGGYYGYNNQQRCCLNRCDHYFSEDNPSSCAIM